METKERKVSGAFGMVEVETMKMRADRIVNFAVATGLCTTR